MNAWLEHNRGHVIVLLLSLIATGGLAFLLRQPAPGGVEILPPPTATAAPTQPLTVYVSGAVARADVYRLADGDRVKQALDAAGGPAPDADLARVNLAAPVHDGDHVHVPRIGESAASVSGVVPTVRATASPPPVVASGKINLNRATIAELESLPGVGPTLAQRIVDYRTSHGQFRKVEDLKEVPGIGDALFERIKDQVVAP